MQFTKKDYQTTIFRYIMALCVFALLFTVAMYAYLGTFSRYLGDDYCEAMLFKDDSPVGAVIERYTKGNWPRATMRYSNLLFVGFSELLPGDNIPIAVIAMIFLWVGGLIYFLSETRKFFQVDWEGQVDFLLGLLLAFFSFLLAPNLFQTVYWRSAVMTHFAPLAFGSVLLGFFVNQFRRADNRSISPVTHVFIFFVAFIIAGFSEPPTTTMLTVLPLIMIVVWVWGNPSARNKRLTLLAWLFAGIFLGLVVMLISPASADAAQQKSRDLVAVLVNSFRYSYLFILDSLRTLPLPFLISTFIPLLFIWLYPGKLVRENPFNRQARPLFIFMAVLPALVWLLIAAGFAPSAYGQSFPVERMRFLARVMLIAAFMVEGALLGLFLKKQSFLRGNALVYWSALIVFVVFCVVYPVRAAYNIIKFEVPEYSQRAQLWDARNAVIHDLIAQGQTDLVVIQFDGVDGVKELDVSDSHWVNRCASKYYGVNSIRAFSE